MPLTTAQAFMGHASISTTMIYAHCAPAHDEGDKLSAAFNADAPMAELETVA
jgi:site-specific recombinase XerD